MSKLKWILVVEDDESIREAMRLLIEEEGYHVVTATNGKDAIDILQDWHTKDEPCIIFCDLMMPIMNGWAFLDHLSKDSIMAVIPVIVMTASEDTKPNKRILKKPFELDIAIRAIRDHCGEGCRKKPIE